MTIRKSILCVDDDLVVLLCHQALWSKRYDIITAENGTLGLKALDNFSPDLIIVDYQMPDMSAIEFIRASNHIRPGIPYVLLSGMKAENIDWEAMHPLGVIGFLKKPMDTNQIAELLPEYLTVE